MTITEAIRQLEEILAKNGDIEVFTTDCHRNPVRATKCDVWHLRKPAPRERVLKWHFNSSEQKDRPVVVLRS